AKGPTGSIDVHEPDPPAAYVIIDSPGARSRITVAASPITLGGMLGDLEPMTNLTWESDRGDSGVLPLEAAWQSQPIDVPAGDTRITVRGILKDGTAVGDAVTVTHNPGIAFSSPLWMTPTQAFAGQVVEVSFSIGLLDPTAPVDSVSIVRTDEKGATIAEVTALAFDGQKWTGTAVMGESQPDRTRLRAKITAGAQTALSETVLFQTFALPDDAVFERARALLDEVVDRYQGLESAGWAPQDARQKLAGFLAEQSDIVWFDTGTRGELFSWQLDSGIRQVFSLRPPEARANPTIGTPKARINESFTFQWTPVGAQLGDTVGPKIKLQLCPRYSVDIETAAKVADYGKLAGNGLLLFSSHGDAGGLRFKSEVFDLDEDTRFETIYTEEINVPKSYALEKVSGQIVMAASTDVFGKEQVYLGVTERFIASVAGGLPDSIVFAATCNSAHHGKLAEAFLGAGAKTYVGATGLVSFDWGAGYTRAFFESLVDGDTPEEAQAFLKGLIGEFDPQWTKTRFRVLGSSKIAATGLCEGKTTYTYKFDGPNGSTDIDASSVDKMSHVPSLSSLLMRSRQETCSHHQLSSDGSAGLDGTGQTSEVYTLDEALDKQLEKTVLNFFYIDPALNNSDWVNYKSFGVGVSDQYADNCPWGFGGPTNPLLDPTEVTQTGIKVDRAAGTGAFDSGTLTVEITFPDKFITE
ncbi:MAG TPA: hypothetical protein PKA88_15000, partial [Polyangiaceae bacterium]|nr:hypothetical protein [Polyangiaceae bacterium]